MTRSLSSWSTAVTVLILLGQYGLPQVRAEAVAQFIFGDSLVDQGNNNNLQSIAKANFEPNGIDLAESNYKPTGRFCNGRIVSDIISGYMGIPSVVAYLDADANGKNLLRGCNFASAGSGILDDTGVIFNQRIALNQQIADFQNVQSQIVSQLGQSAADQLISKAIFAFTTGGNDFINNYLLPVSPRAEKYNAQEFTQLVISTLQGQIKTVYGYGARKFSFANIGPLGCIPFQIQSDSKDGSCVESVNQYAIGYNALLKPMLDGLQESLPGVTICYSDSYSGVEELINNPSSYGFVSANTACCGAGRFNGLIPCNVATALCSNRDQYLFWDPFHPTDKANGIVAQKLLFGGPPFITPVNISTLILM